MLQAFTVSIPVSYPPLTVDKPENPLATNLIKYREEKFGTQEKLAEASGFKQSVISKWEAGKATPKPKSLLRLARAFGRTVEDLLAGVDETYDAHRVDLIRHNPEYQSAPSIKDGADDARAALDRSLIERLADAEAGLAATLELIGGVRAQLDDRAAPPRHEKRRARR